MLKFLQNRPQDQSPKRSPIKYLPEMCYGNSFESPKQFQTPHTIFYRRSYISPFLKFEPKRAQRLSDHTALEPSWTNKVNLTLVEEHKIVGKEVQEVPPQSRYLQSFYKQFQADPRRFRITRGEFTNFIEKNNHYKSMGPMQGIQRQMDRIRSRQQSVWIKQPSKRQEMTASLRYASSLNTTIKSSIAENSQMLTQKIRIRRNRERVQKMFKLSLEHRKKDGTSVRFQLPRKGPQHELCLLDDSINVGRSKKQGRQEKVNQEELQHFEGKIGRIFK